MPVSANALAVLDRIEAIEMRSLEWGFTDGSLSESEAFALGDEVCDAANATGTDGQDLVEELIDAKLIFEMASVSGEVRIRSRFAEMMRLLAANRQLFPNKPWQGAPYLVADFRVDCRPRRFPQRRRLPADILSDNQAVLGGSALRQRFVAGADGPGRHEACRHSRSARRYACRRATDDGGTIVTAGTGSGKTICILSARHDPHWRSDRRRPLGQSYRDLSTDRTTQGPVCRGISHGANDRSDTCGARPPAARSSAPCSARPRPGRRARNSWTRVGSAGARTLSARGCAVLAATANCVWRGVDIAAGTERLACVQHSCGEQIGDDKIVLTRDPPATSAARHLVHHDRDAQPTACPITGCAVCSGSVSRTPASRCSRCSTRCTPTMGRPALKPR